MSVFALAMPTMGFAEGEAAPLRLRLERGVSVELPPDWVVVDKGKRSSAKEWVPAEDGDSRAPQQDSARAADFMARAADGPAIFLKARVPAAFSPEALRALTHEQLEGLGAELLKIAASKLQHAGERMLNTTSAELTELAGLPAIRFGYRYRNWLGEKDTISYVVAAPGQTLYIDAIHSADEPTSTELRRTAQRILATIRVAADE